MLGRGFEPRLLPLYHLHYLEQLLLKMRQMVSKIQLWIQVVVEGDVLQEVAAVKQL
jgi:hypothetical protein